MDNPFAARTGNLNPCRCNLRRNHGEDKNKQKAAEAAFALTGPL
ncbi:hypothetical protein X737_00940 [Mesorhizobium sp. L48C026A00]|nr:hypothetical protein X737_00940 [Mesorhizobium sp. L48C026A00]